MDRPEHSQEYEQVWDKPYYTWGQALPNKFTGAGVRGCSISSSYVELRCTQCTAAECINVVKLQPQPRNEPACCAFRSRARLTDLHKHRPLQPTDQAPRHSRCAGNMEEVRQEVERLSQKWKLLRKDDASIAAIAADEKADPDGQMLALLLRWREQRLHAIELEMQRLLEQADELRDEL